MPRYHVLVISQEYREIEASSAKDASMTAFRMYQNGEIEPNACPEFVCEEADLIEEEENEL
jgi:hypothetical protein